MSMKVNIKTFGCFDVIYDGQSLIKNRSRKYRLYKLLQYFITYRNRGLLPENIIDNLFIDSESSDPKSVLRMQIFRLRDIIKNIIPDDVDEKDYFSLNFTNGHYILELGNQILVDTDEFEILINKADSYLNSNVNGAMDLYLQALEIYEGPYLAEYTREIWVIPIRNHYSRLYLKTLDKIIDILNEYEKYYEIINLCEKALMLFPYEESIHIHYLDAMIETGDIVNAIKYFEYTKKIFEAEFGIKCSPRINKIDRKIKKSLEDIDEVDIDSLISRLDNDTEEGAMYCSIEDFKALYTLERRKSSRVEELNFLAIITIDANKRYDSDEIKKWSHTITTVLKYSLRTGDVFTFWNENSILIMLYNVRDDGLQKIEGRIRRNLAPFGMCNIIIEYKPLFR